MSLVKTQEPSGDKPKTSKLEYTYSKLTLQALATRGIPPDWGDWEGKQGVQMADDPNSGWRHKLSGVCDQAQFSSITVGSLAFQNFLTG